MEKKNEKKTCGVMVRKLRTAQRIPESLSAFCRIVSFTAAKTSRIFDVSVACVRLQMSDLVKMRARGRLTEGRDSDVLCLLG